MKIFWCFEFRHADLNVVMSVLALHAAMCRYPCWILVLCNFLTLLYRLHISCCRNSFVPGAAVVAVRLPLRDRALNISFALHRHALRPNHRQNISSLNGMQVAISLKRSPVDRSRLNFFRYWEIVPMMYRDHPENRRKRKRASPQIRVSEVMQPHVLQ